MWHTRTHGRTTHIRRMTALPNPDMVDHVVVWFIDDNIRFRSHLTGQPDDRIEWEMDRTDDPGWPGYVVDAITDLWSEFDNGRCANVDARWHEPGGIVGWGLAGTDPEQATFAPFAVVSRGDRTVVVCEDCAATFRMPEFEPVPA